MKSLYFIISTQIRRPVNVVENRIQRNKIYLYIKTCLSCMIQSYNRILFNMSTHKEIEKTYPLHIQRNRFDGI